jgi:2-isopropylmalate synthase
VDAAMQAIDRIVKRRGHLAQYSVEAVTQGRDSLGEVTLKADFGNNELITGKGASTDIIEASARAYINAVNRAELLHGHKQAAALAPI